MAYSEKQKKEIINTICDCISEDKFSLRDACVFAEINRNTFYQWIDKNEEFANQYARATSDRADAIFEEILDIADDQENDVYEDKDGNEQINHNVIQRARLRVDSRKWMLGKMNPKKYGEKVQQEIDLNAKVNIKPIDWAQ